MTEMTAEVRRLLNRRTMRTSPIGSDVPAGTSPAERPRRLRRWALAALTDRWSAVPRSTCYA